MTHNELVNAVYEILRADMEYIHVTNADLKRNIENAGDMILKAFLEDRGV